MAARERAEVSSQIGSWAFIIGLVIAIIAGFVVPGSSANYANAALVLGVLGIIVGLLNISEREVTQFLIAAIAFVVAFASLGNVLSVIPAIGGYIPNILNYLVVFVAPAAAVVAIRALFQMSRSR